MTFLAHRLAEWAAHYEPSESDLALARRSLLDTVAGTLAARDHELVDITADLPKPARWAALGHVLDYDDLHMESTTHISVVCVSASLAAGGGARAYLAGAGTMARLGNALGWRHYSQGWHATCTAGAPSAAVAAAVAMDLSAEQIMHAIVLAVPAAGGNQRAFGSQAKALQVGFAAAAGVRAARLAAAGATADPGALEQWMELVGGDPGSVSVEGPAIPDGLAIKLFPCCYALQRPIFAAQLLASAGIEIAGIKAITVETLEGTVRPLEHHRPLTGLEAKFSLEYAIAAALLDGNPGFDSFSDAFVQRETAQQLLRTVDTRLAPGGTDLLAGQLTLTAHMHDGSTARRSIEVPPGAPALPPTDEQLAAKLATCGDDVPGLLRDVDWSSAAELLTDQYSVPAYSPG